jgi:hypothetical protein
MEYLKARNFMQWNVAEFASVSHLTALCAAQTQHWLAGYFPWLAATVLSSLLFGPLTVCLEGPVQVPWLRGGASCEVSSVMVRFSVICGHQTSVKAFVFWLWRKILQIQNAWKGAQFKRYNFFGPLDYFSEDFIVHYNWAFHYSGFQPLYVNINNVTWISRALLGNNGRFDSEECYCALLGNTASNEDAG